MLTSTAEWVLRSHCHLITAAGFGSSYGLVHFLLRYYLLLDSEKERILGKMRAKLQICVLIILNCLALSRCEQVNEVADFRKLLVSWQRSNEKLIQILDTKDDLNNLKEDFQNGKSHLQNQIIQLNANFTALRNNDNELKEQFLELMTNFSSTSRKLNEEEDKIEYLKNQSQIHENNYISFKDEIQHQIQIQLHASKVEQKQLKDDINALKANLSLAQIKIEAQEEEIRRKQQLKFQDCEDVKIALGSSYTAGVHTIFINFLPTVVYCDEVGYTVIQSRGQFGNPSDYFFREWNDYLEPFGAPGIQLYRNPDMGMGLGVFFKILLRVMMGPHFNMNFCQFCIFGGLSTRSFTPPLELPRTSRCAHLLQSHASNIQ